MLPTNATKVKVNNNGASLFFICLYIHTSRGNTIERVSHEQVYAFLPQQLVHSPIDHFETSQIPYLMYYKLSIKIKTLQYL